MVLNLLRVEGINPEFMLERSFYQFQNFSTLPTLQESVYCVDKNNLILVKIHVFYFPLFKEALKAREKYKSIQLIKETEVEGYYSIKREIESYGRQLHEIITKPLNIVPFLQVGRLIKVIFKMLCMFHSSYCI